MSAVDKLLKIASAEIGYAEKASKAGLDEKTFKYRVNKRYLEVFLNTIIL